MVKKNKNRNAFESYRYIVSKGKNATAMNMITMRSRALRPLPAATIKDIEACIVKWKADIAYIESVDTGYEKKHFQKDDKKSIQVNMLP